jgi:hypothetical protein
VVVTAGHEDCWRRLEYTRGTFVRLLKNRDVSAMADAKLTSPAVTMTGGHHHE